MNIMFYNQDLTANAAGHSDIHVNSQLKEAIQIASTNIWYLLYQDDPRFNLLGSNKRNDDIVTQKSIWRQLTGLSVPTHVNHPAMKWGRETLGNFCYVIDYAKALADEFKYRTGKTHGAARKIALLEEAAQDVDYLLPEVDFKPAVVFKTEGLHLPLDKDVYSIYREYFNTYKTTFTRGDKVIKQKWTKRGAPAWVHLFDNQ